LRKRCIGCLWLVGFVVHVWVGVLWLVGWLSGSRLAKTVWMAVVGSRSDKTDWRVVVGWLGLGWLGLGWLGQVSAKARHTTQPSLPWFPGSLVVD
jgi:hypothetical protein